MAYITEAQLIARYGEDKLVQLTAPSGGDAMDADVLGAAMADADKLINSYLCPRYPLPLAQPLLDASPLPRMAGDIVIYLLQDDLAIEESQARYDRAMVWLKRVQMGQASLGAGDTEVATATGTFRRAKSRSGFDFASY